MTEKVDPQVALVVKGQGLVPARPAGKGDHDAFAVQVLEERGGEQESVPTPGARQLLDIVRVRQRFNQSLRGVGRHAGHVGREGVSKDLHLGPLGAGLGVVGGQPQDLVQARDMHACHLHHVIADEVPG